MKAREFLARRKHPVEERNLIKQPLSAAELRALAKKAGGAEQLVAPKRRAEAEGLAGDELIAWLAEDGGRVRRPIIEVGGEIDVYTAPKLREQLVDLVNDGRYHLVVDMEAVEFLDSTGLGVLVGGLKRVRAHDGSLRLVCTQERILKIFRITGLTKVFPIHESVSEAVAAQD